MSVVSLVALAVGTLLNADPKRIARIVGGMRIAILPMFALIFLLDWVTSAGVVAPALYAVPVLATSLCVSLEWSFASALFASALTYIGYFISQPAHTTRPWLSYDRDRPWTYLVATYAMLRMCRPYLQ
jgi:hypothetical protein